MHRQIDLLREFWEPRFPGQLARDPVVAEPLAAESIELEGRALVPIGVGHTDTVDTTVLHVPETGLVVAGDVVYNDVHVHLAQSDGGSRREWLAALDTVAALGSRAVVAGHKRPGNDDGPGSIAETSRYIRDFDQLVTMATSSLDLCERMLALHPNRVNPGVLWLSARALEAQLLTDVTGAVQRGGGGVVRVNRRRWGHSGARSSPSDDGLHRAAAHHATRRAGTTTVDTDDTDHTDHTERQDSRSNDDN